MFTGLFLSISMYEASILEAPCLAPQIAVAIAPIVSVSPPMFAQSKAQRSTVFA